MSISRPRSPSESNDLPEPQLEMVREDLRELPEIVVPEGYGLRNYGEGDEADWCAIMDGNIGVDWTVETCRQKLVEDAQFEPDCLFFATCGGETVGSACAWQEGIDEQRVGEVHLVAAADLLWHYRGVVLFGLDRFGPGRARQDPIAARRRLRHRRATCRGRPHASPIYSLKIVLMSRAPWSTLTISTSFSFL